LRRTKEAGDINDHDGCKKKTRRDNDKSPIEPNLKKEDVGLLAAGGRVPRRLYKINRHLFPAPRVKGKGIRATHFPVWMAEIMTPFGSKIMLQKRRKRK
jgi:hypothetical protein